MLGSGAEPVTLSWEGLGQQRAPGPRHQQVGTHSGHEVQEARRGSRDARGQENPERGRAQEQDGGWRTEQPASCHQVPVTDTVRPEMSKTEGCVALGRG